MMRTNTCGELTKGDLKKKVKLAGWVHSRRDHGGIIFIDLRDNHGITQVTFDPKIDSVAHKHADPLRNEWVILVEGEVVARPDDMVNKKLITGEIEVEATKLEILSQSKTPPFDMHEEKAGEANEQIRLEYRFVDLRRKKLQDMLVTKDKFIQHMREYFRKNKFTEVQTPILANSSPEGARDFLVPSRIHEGKFYALPQAPQQFKQLLMVGGIDRYYQVAPCFRDEDPRADRHYGEFYQLDMELSFVEQEDIFNIVEPLFLELTKEFSNKEIVNLDENGKFPRIAWRDSMEKYGTDKPDLRFGFEIEPITNLVKNCNFKVFADMAEKKGHVVHAMKINGGAKFTRKEIDELTILAQEKGAKGLAYIIVKDNEALQSPIVKFLGDDLSKKIVEKVEAKKGDIIFFGADEFSVVCRALGSVRNECGEKLGLKDKNKGAFAWIVDFPMYEYSEIEEGRVDFGHNPFSMPQGGIDALNSQEPFDILAYQFDIAFNGFEVLSGAIRNHNPKIMYKAFEIAGYQKDEVIKRFGAMIKAFEYGAPPHGGSAIGLDRLLMTLMDMESIRDIYAFPKDGQGRDLMMDSPSSVNEMQLRDAHIKLRKQIK